MKQANNYRKKGPPSGPCKARSFQQGRYFAQQSVAGGFVADDRDDNFHRSPPHDRKGRSDFLTRWPRTGQGLFNHSHERRSPLTDTFLNFCLVREFCLSPTSRSGSKGKGCDANSAGPCLFSPRSPPMRRARLLTVLQFSFFTALSKGNEQRLGFLQ